MKPQHQHFSYFYPLPWTLNTPLQPPCIQMIPCPGSGAMLCCCPRWSGGNNISEVSLSIIQTWSDLITLRHSVLSTTNTNTTLEVCKQSVFFFSFIQSWVESVSLCQVGQQSNSYPISELCIDRDKSIIFLLYPLFEAQNAAHVTRDTCAGPGHAPSAGPVLARGRWWWHETMRNESGPDVNTDTWTEF